MKNREKGEKRMQKFLRRLERFSQSLLSPLSYLSAAGLLLVLGALLSLPHKGLVVQGTRVQLVCGLHAAQLRHALEQQLAEMAPV